MINFSPWFYRKLLSKNNIINNPEFYKVNSVNNILNYEANVYLKSQLRPSWVSSSVIYKNCDGSGTSTYKNIAVYKAISEALERLAFYELADTDGKKYCFDINPTTTGMAAYPSFMTTTARRNAIVEARERWAIHEFNRFKVPVIEHENNISNLRHYELKIPFKDSFVSLLSYKHENFYAYSFAGGVSLNYSFNRAIIEIDRNIRVLLSSNKKNVSTNFKSATDKTIFYYSTDQGYQNFLEKIKLAPSRIVNQNPRVLCDKEMKGLWSPYTKVWRYLLEDSYHSRIEDKTFFMF